MRTLPGVPSVAQIGVVEVPGIGSVPLVDMPRFDERATCGVVLRYLAHELAGVPSDYTGCPAYAGGQCRRQGGGAVCAFLEADNAQVWQRAAGWRLLEDPDGYTCVTPARTALEVAQSLGARIVGAELAEVPR
jgi:hypothetical protein